MLQWLKDRFEIIGLTFRHPGLLAAFGLFQAAVLLLGRYLPPAEPNRFYGGLLSIPWYSWTIGWLAVLWLTTLEYSVHRKKSFDETSNNFFKAYLDFVIREGHGLFNRADDKNFYTQVNEWQRRAVMGIAIGLGPKESEKFFQKMEGKSPLQEAYRKSREARSNEALCRALQDNLDELGGMRMKLLEGVEKEKGGLATLKNSDPDFPGTPSSARGSEIKRLPPS